MQNFDGNSINPTSFELGFVSLAILRASKNRFQHRPSYVKPTVHNQSGQKQNIHLHSFTSLPNVKFDTPASLLLIRPSSKHRFIQQNRWSRLSRNINSRQFRNHNRNINSQKNKLEKCLPDKFGRVFFDDGRIFHGGIFSEQR